MIGLQDREVGMVVLRLYSAALSAFIFVVYMPNPGYLLYRLSPYWNCWSEHCEAQWYWYADLAFKIQVLMAVLWMVLWAVLEVRSFRRFTKPAPKLLTHLRYGPIAIFVLSVATIFTYDAMMIQYTRWQLIRWIHSDAAVTETPSINLYNNDRGWCGNGIAATEYWLYGDTPAAYIDDADPATRARALQASMYVYDWINQPKDGPSIDALKKAAADPDPMVRDVAAKLRVELTGAP